MARRRRVRHDIIHRWEGNPAIGMADLSFPCLDICNAGAVRLRDRYVLLLTIQNLDGCESIYLAESADGFHFEVSGAPVMWPSREGAFAEYESNGVEDPRITLLEGQYYVCYTAGSPLGLRLALARTRDFRSFERVALTSEPDTKHGCLFPERVKGRYARLERPREGGSIWVSYSDDLVHWGASEIVLGPRGGFWDQSRIGPGAPPMPVDEGWLLTYYGIKETSAGPLFRIGAAVLDRAEPTRVLGRSDVPLLSPRESYERIGDVGNLVFTCGAVLEPDGELRLYYGGANSCICIGTAPVAEIVDRCMAWGGGG